MRVRAHALYRTSVHDVHIQAKRPITTPKIDVNLLPARFTEVHEIGKRFTEASVNDGWKEHHMTVTVTIPAAIDRRLGPNGRIHWGKKGQLKKQLRNTAAMAMLATPRQSLPPAPWVIDYEIGLKRQQKEFDDDNAVGALKPLRDGIADYAGIDDRYIRSGQITWTRDPRGVGFISVTIRSAA